VSAGGVLLCALLFLLVLEPAQERHVAAMSQLQHLVDEFTWLSAQAPAVAALSTSAGASGGRVTTESPLGAVDQSARAAGLGGALRRVRPQESGVEAELEGAAYTALVRWLAALETQYGLRIETLSLDPGGEPGRVNAQIRVEPAGGRR